jgi:hypothetical protein
MEKNKQGTIQISPTLSVEIVTQDRDILDEIKIHEEHGVFLHLEKMTEETYWLRIDQREYDLRLGRKGLVIIERE